MLIVASLLLAITAQQPVAAKWLDQTIAPGLVVSAPVKLKLSTEPVEDSAMSKSEMWIGTAENCSFIVSVSTFKEPSKVETASVFTGSAAGLASIGEGTEIIGLKDILLQGWPGLAVTVRDPQGVILVARFFRTPDKLIQVASGYATSDQRPAPVNRFLDSLKLPGNGDAKTAGPVLTRFPLGESGLTALFPRAPQRKDIEIGKGPGKGTMHVFSSDYALRSFIVGYRDLPVTDPPSADDVDKLLVGVTDDVLESFKAKQSKRANEKVGEAQGLRCEFTISNQAKGSLLVYLRGTQLISILEFAPRAYDSPGVADAFLHSIEAKA